MNREIQRKVFCIGETVLDIIFVQGQPVAAKPGGSLTNSAVSLARSGADVQLISEIFQDDPGRMILQFLSENNVATDFLVPYKEGNTPIALAFLNEKAEASYSFYKLFPEKRIPWEMPVPTENDIVLFGSFYAITQEIRGKLLTFLQNARNNNAFIIYDPNFRKSHLKDLPAILPMILENISFSDIIRGSHEDFLHIFATDNPVDAFLKIRHSGCNNLIYTKQADAVMIFSDNNRFSFPVPSITPVSTIGAGDSFNAGLICGLLREKLKRQDITRLEETRWKTLIDEGVRFAGEVCLSMDNYVPENFSRLY